MDCRLSACVCSKRLMAEKASLQRASVASACDPRRRQAHVSWPPWTHPPATGTTAGTKQRGVATTTTTAAPPPTD